MKAIENRKQCNECFIMDAICFVWLIWRKWRSASLSKPRAILNVEKTIVFTGSLNIASSLADINQRYLMQWCTIWRCSHSANIRLDIFKWGPLASDTLSVSLTNWRENWFYLSPRLNNIYLQLFERNIHRWIPPDNPSSKWPESKDQMRWKA